MTEPTFTKEQLLYIAQNGWRGFALSLIERADRAEADLNRFVGRISAAVGSPCVEFGRGKSIEEAVVEFVERRVVDYIETINERDQARRELEALIEWRRTTSLDELVYGTGAMHEVVDLRVERDRLREELREGDT